MRERIAHALRVRAEVLREAQEAFAVRPMPREKRSSRTPAREAAVLCLCYPIGERFHLLLTRRAETVQDHRGQISFPGGAREAEDASLEETAVRESKEELGLDPDGYEIVGALPAVEVWVSRYRVIPYVGIAPLRPAFRPDPKEVAEIIEVPLSHLMDPKHVEEEEWVPAGIPLRVPFYRYGTHKIWGATARMIAMLAAGLTATESAPPGE